jgi:hypothetical protein
MTIDRFPHREIRNQVHRYFLALYGPDYAYHAPETFSNLLEQWMLAIGRGTDESLEWASKLMTQIELSIAEYDASLPN